MSTSAPTSSFVRGPVTTAAIRVDTLVIATERATSPLAISVTRFDAVPPARRTSNGRPEEREGGGRGGGGSVDFVTYSVHFGRVFVCFSHEAKGRSI